MTTPKPLYNVIAENIEKDFAVPSYISQKIELLTNERNRLYERQRLGLEINQQELSLIEYKISKTDLYALMESLDIPCEKYCNYLYEQERTEEEKVCREKYYYSMNEMRTKYYQIYESYENKSITKQEFEKLKNELVIKHKKYVNELDRILNLKEIPTYTACQQIPYEEKLAQQKEEIEHQKKLENENKKAEENKIRKQKEIEQAKTAAKSQRDADIKMYNEEIQKLPNTQEWAGMRAKYEEYKKESEKRYQEELKRIDNIH